MTQIEYLQCKRCGGLSPLTPLERAALTEPVCSECWTSDELIGVARLRYRLALNRLDSIARSQRLSRSGMLSRDQELAEAEMRFLARVKDTLHQVYGVDEESTGGIVPGVQPQDPVIHYAPEGRTLCSGWVRSEKSSDDPTQVAGCLRCVAFALQDLEDGGTYQGRCFHCREKVVALGGVQWRLMARRPCPHCGREGW